MPFTLRSLEDEKKAKMGVIECINHKIVEPFHVLFEKEGEFSAQFKFTVLLMPSGSHKITGLPVDLDLYTTDFSLDDAELKQLLNASIGHKAGKKKKKKGPKSGMTTSEGEGDKAEDEKPED